MLTRCHFIGIGGIGMSGLAKLLINNQVQVSGSDISDNATTQELSKAGAKIYLGHSSDNIQDCIPVVYTTDIPLNNPELEAAKKLKCPLWHRSDLLHQIMQGYKPLVITGTHGKTTTTALLLAVLHHAGFDPPFAVGGIVKQFQTNAGQGKGDYFVAEGDESDGSFLKYSPFGAIVTNIDLDHMNYYQTEAALTEAFSRFIKNISSTKNFFWCGDDLRLSALNPLGISYGFGNACTLKIENFQQQGWGSKFDIVYEGNRYSAIRTPMTGRHNALNAAAVFGLALSIGAAENKIREAFGQFGGVKRRCDKKGEINNIEVYDDYAHHPTEIETTLQAIRQAVAEKRLIAVLQPHRYTRMQHCLGAFGQCLKDADEIIVTDLYEAGESPIPGVTTQAIFEEIKSSYTIPTHYVARNQLKPFLLKFAQPNDVIVTLGAGDITKVGSDLIAAWQEHPPQKLKICIFFGGQSVEHEISINSARFFLSCVKPNIYDVSAIAITKQGRWISGDWALTFLRGDQKSVPELSLPEKIPAEALNALQKCDLILPILHGPYGEDGTVQGLFEMIGKPYIGAGHEASAVFMNKALLKKLLQWKGIPTIPFVDFAEWEWKKDRDQLLDKIHGRLRYPVFVKPVHLGSSIGIAKANDLKILVDAIENALIYDTHVIVENGMLVREIDFAVLGNDEFLQVFPPGEILTKGEIFDYERKYSTNGTPKDVIAKLSDELVERGMRIVKEAFLAAGGQGLARVDTFLDTDNQFWVNEINPIPGCTQTSIYPSICRLYGIDGSSLLDKLVVCGLQRKRKRDRLKV